MNQHEPASDLAQPYQPETLEVLLSVQLASPSGPLFLDGLRLRVDRYMYDLYSREPKTLELWLQQQAFDWLRQNSTVRSVPLGPQQGPQA